MLLVLSVFEQEMEPLAHHMVTFESGQVFSRPFLRGVLGRNEVITLSGILGKVEAACITQKMLGDFPIQSVVLVSGAGALDPALQVGTVVAGNCYQEFDRVLHGGCQPEPVAGFPPLLQLFCHDFPEVKVGKIISGDEIVQTASRRDALLAEFQAIALDMDSAAVARVAQLNGVCFQSIKVILDVCDEKAQEEYNQNFPSFAPLPASMLASFFSHHFLATECSR
ncbi:MAG TPA: 5'-methylthioadenosine/S-adenosylhomocysteine nucleosidase [Thermotogota bacterium]|nr:5'-methylthioadenosine/S-adenosylhomocysteine nucleosidase [Thermotogota bacterium]HRW91975.1 5'-methylthioadenosine/S-adenosylhomocysteine nucleosidase [Thermotogota bacterium]